MKIKNTGITLATMAAVLFVGTALANPANVPSSGIAVAVADSSNGCPNGCPNKNKKSSSKHKPVTKKLKHKQAHA